MITCIKCNKVFSTHQWIDGKTRNLCGRKRCLDCQPWKAPRFPPRTLEESLQASRAKSKKYYLKQRKKLGIDPHKYRTRRRKQALIDFFGGCVFCKYNKTPRALSFHHCFDKKFTMDASGLTKCLQDVIFEISKCIMVCHNCHCEIHDGLLNDKDKFKDFQNKVDELKTYESWKDFMTK